MSETPAGNTEKSRFLVECCLHKVPDPFYLVLLASYRAKELSSGAQSPLLPGTHKESVMAMQEICQGALDVHQLEERLIQSFQTHSFFPRKS